MTRRIVVAGTALLAGACASVDPRPAFVDVQRESRAGSGTDARWTRTPAEATAVDGALDRLLADPLTAESAVAIALVANPSLQATFEELGIAQADLAQASRLSNPEVGALVRFPHQGGGSNVELSLVQDVFDLVARPLRAKVAAAQLEQTKLRIAHEVLALAGDVREAFVTLQAAEELVARLELVRDVTGTAAEFARAQHRAGTINELELESRTVIEREAVVDVAVAATEARAGRERLQRLLGLWGPRTAWTASRVLPDVPADEVPLPGLERIAVTRRQDLRAARWGVDQVGRALALRKKTRFFPVGLQFGLNTEKEVTGERVTGPELRLQLPLFDTGKASVARLEAEHRRAQRQLEALAVEARSQVREQHGRMQAARALARYHREEVLPQRRRILELTVQHYNAMFKGAYDLLLAKQSEVAAERAALDAWRDYWIARARLERAVGGPLVRETGKEADR
jgi:cobalt-zinc-cadmium efflux system outer membrane protein